MNRKDLSRISLLIFSILVVSVLLGDIIITPIILYHQFLVTFFGFFFFILLFLLLAGKLYSNYSYLKDRTKSGSPGIVLLSRTFKETLSQILARTGRSFLYIIFLIIVASVTIFAIWFNGLLVKI